MTDQQQRRHLIGHGMGGMLGMAMGPWAHAPARATAPTAQTPRLVSLSGGMTEVVWQLGAQHMVVATDTTSTYPPQAQHTTKVGYMRQLSAEGILALRPTAVLGTHEVGPSTVLAQLKQAGVSLLLAQADHSFNELLTKVQLASQASGLQEAGRALAAELTMQWQQAQGHVNKHRQQRQQRGNAAPRVLFVMCHGGRPQSAGHGTAAHAMLAFAGASNALHVDKGYKALSAEAVAQARPDLIVTTTESVQASGGLPSFWQHPGLAHTPAARKADGLIAMDAMALLGFGPRLPTSLLSLHKHVFGA